MKHHILQKPVRKLNSERVRKYKEQLFKICDPICYICNKNLNIVNSTIDHLIPKSLGGTNTLANLALACYDCNQSKLSNLYKEHLAYICNRLQVIPDSVEDFFDLLAKNEMITDKPYDFNELSSKLITFIYLIGKDPITLSRVWDPNRLHDLSVEMPTLIPGAGKTSRRRKIKNQHIGILKDQMIAEECFSCFICSENKNVVLAKIVSQAYGGTDDLRSSIANLAPICEDCMVREQGILEKYKINYIIKRDFKEHKDCYPTTVEEIYGHMYHTCVLREQIKEEQKAKLFLALKEMFEFSE